ncbi:penicillin-binding protein 2 [Nocardioides marinquilinus]|uniref:peptidoglycan D,D-transpeptidase FtsI family protein n=1 Tax=Nocardioides marinquilinus TaxID=1210400 RepID=UPI0031E6F913
MTRSRGRRPAGDRPVRPARQPAREPARPARRPSRPATASKTTKTAKSAKPAKPAKAKAPGRRPARPAAARPAATTRRPGRLRRRPRGSLRGSSTFRLRAGFVLIAMVLSLFGARLVQLQGIDPQQYAAMAAAEGEVSVVLPAERGDILDRNGRPLADSIDGLMIAADPSLTSGKAPQLATFLTRRLGVDYFETLEHLRAPTRFEYIAREVPAAEAREVVDDAAEKGFVGLETREDPVRVYPARTIAANLVGFLGTPHKDGSARPLAGFEDSFNTYLSGTDGEARYQVGSNGSRIPLGDNVMVPARDGTDLTTTIDSDLQWYAQQVLAETVRAARADSGFAVVLDSRTGEVLALPDYPTYDAAEPDLSPESLYSSRALTDVYEPGSVQKVLTVAGLVDAGLVTDRTRFEVPGVLLRQDRPIHDYFEHGTIKLTMAGILAKSSNIGTVMAADEYAPGQLRRYLKGFGLGTRTGVGVPGETNGILPAGADWTSQTGDRIAFGQSLSVNALQMAAAVNTIANGGVRVDPSLVRGTATLDDGTEVGSGAATTRRVVSEDAARQTTLMMERVIDPEAGVAPGAAVPGYRVAGKTGTAQRVGEAGTYDGTFTVSFAGFAPADDPRFTVYVVVQNPRNGGGGGSVAGPAFSKIMGHALRRYGVPPTGTQPSRLPVEW